MVGLVSLINVQYQQSKFDGEITVTVGERFVNWGNIRGEPLDILGGGQENFPCKNFFLVESLVRIFFSW